MKTEDKVSRLKKGDRRKKKKERIKRMFLPETRPHQINDTTGSEPGRGNTRV